MSDYSRLQAQAEAATPGPWFADNSRHEGSINAADRHIGMVSMYAEKREDIPQNFANQEFIAAANPAVVLELIADIGQWKKAFTRIAGELSVMALTHAGMTEEAPLQQAIDFVKGAMVERDQLKAEIERLKHDHRLLTEHNEFLASSDSRLAPELRAVKDALGLDFTASVSGEVVPAIEKLREGGLELLKAAYWLGWDCSNEVQNGEHLANARDLAWWVERRDKEIADLASKRGK